MENQILDDLKEVIIRDTKVKYTYRHYNEKGHVFITEDNKKGIQLPDLEVRSMMNGSRYTLKGKHTQGKFFVDWSLRDERFKREEKESELKIKEEKGEAHNDYVMSVIPDNDPEVIAYRDFLNIELNQNVPVLDSHIHFIYAMRYKYKPTLIGWLGHPKGWNDASKKFFTHMTGIKLPSTKKGIIEAIEGFCNEPVVV